jgi:hypothetical protein
MNHGDKERVLHDFYSSLLGATPGGWDPRLASVLPPIEGLSALELPFTEVELRESLWSMRSDSSPGPDGFGPTFFKSFWHVVKGDLMAFLEDFHRGGAHLTGSIKCTLHFCPSRMTC